MKSYTLLVIEATGIQDYIFGTNQLLQHIGASQLVWHATVEKVYALLPSPHNFDGFDTRMTPLLSARGLDDGLAAEVLFVGGGKALVRFDKPTAAIAFTKELTRQVLVEAPGLHLVVEKRYVKSPSEEPLKEVHQSLLEALAKRKQAAPLSAPQMGVSVTADCVFTGKPASEVRDGQRLSPEVVAKLNAAEDGKARMQAQFPEVRERGYEFASDFNELGSKGESSYLAVIHADGNNMGERIKALAKGCATDDEYIDRLRAFSDAARDRARYALDRTLALLTIEDNICDDPEDNKHNPPYKLIGGVVPVPTIPYSKREDPQIGATLPVRPIIIGGDDVTFVCEGRLGLAIAAYYLQVLTEQTLSDGKPFFARAGMVVVNNHYPFARAYGLAEELAASAKTYIKLQESLYPQGMTAFDWHFAVGGMVRSLNDIRRREYTVRDREDAARSREDTALEGNLVARPLRVYPKDGDWHTWYTFQKIVRAFNEDEMWSARNKLKSLREALRAGPEAVTHFLQIHDKPSQLPEIAGMRDMAYQGWQGGVCGYFDALEALDFYVNLKGGAL